MKGLGEAHVNGDSEGQWQQQRTVETATAGTTNGSVATVVLSESLGERSAAAARRAAWKFNGGSTKGGGGGDGGNGKQQRCDSGAVRKAWEGASQRRQQRVASTVKAETTNSCGTIGVTFESLGERRQHEGRRESSTAAARKVALKFNGGDMKGGGISDGGDGE